MEPVPSPDPAPPEAVAEAVAPPPVEAPPVEPPPVEAVAPVPEAAPIAPEPTPIAPEPTPMETEAPPVAAPEPPPAAPEPAPAPAPVAAPEPEPEPAPEPSPSPEPEPAPPAADPAPVAPAPAEPEPPALAEPEPPAPVEPEAEEVPAPEPEPPAPEPEPPAPEPEPMEAAPAPVEEPPAPKAPAPVEEPPAPEASAPETETPSEPDDGRARRPKRAAPGIDPGRVTQSARTGGLLHTASGRQQAKALVDEAVFRRERILDVYHAVESLCFYTAKEMTAQMEVIDGALTLRVPHGPTAMRVVVGDLLAVLPKHLIALKSLTKTQTEAWFPGSDTHWGLESADGLPGYRRRAMTTLETLCEVAASGKHRRLYNAITAEVVSSVQDLARIAALELASKKKIKKKIGQRGVPEEQAAKDAEEFLELARAAAQTLKSVCTLFEWRDQYAAAAAATYPPTPGRNPLGAPSRDTLLDAVVDAAFVAVRRATPLPSVGTVQSVDAVAPARALLAGAARLAGVEGAAGVFARGGVDRLRPILRLALAATRLAAAAPEDPSGEIAAAAALAAAKGEAPPPASDASKAAAEARDALLPVATHGLGLLQTLLDLEQEHPKPFCFLDAAAADDGEDGVADMLAAAVGAVLRATTETMDAQTTAAMNGWIGDGGANKWEKTNVPEQRKGEFAGLMDEEEEKAATQTPEEAEAAKKQREAEEAEHRARKLPPPVGRGSGALILAAMRSAEALSVDSGTQVATMDALAVPLARTLSLPEDVFAQWWCGGGAARLIHTDDSDVQAAAAAAAAAATDGPDGAAQAKSSAVSAMFSPDPGCRIPHAVREDLASDGLLRVAERALLLHHLLGNLHIHDARVAGGVDRGRFLGLIVDELGGSKGHEESGADGGVLSRAFKNLETLHEYARKSLPEGTVAEHDVVIVDTLIAEFKTHTPGGGGAEAAAAAAAASAAAAAAAAPKVDAMVA